MKFLENLIPFSRFWKKGTLPPGAAPGREPPRLAYGFQTRSLVTKHIQKQKKFHSANLFNEFLNFGTCQKWPILAPNYIFGTDKDISTR